MTWDQTASAASPHASSGGAGATPVEDSRDRATSMSEPSGTASPASASTADASPTSSSSSTETDFELYPPTETDDWLRCPMFRKYRHQSKWVPRDEEWMPNMLLGNAIHAATAAHYLGKDEGAIIEAARQVLEAEYVENDEHTPEGLWKLIEKTIPVAIKTDLIGAGKIVAVEKRFLRCKADLIYRDAALDGLGVWDHKVKYELDSRYRDRVFTDYLWQLRHNAWAAQEHYGEPVRMIGVHLIVVTGRPRTYVNTTLLEQGQIAQWATTARRVWSLMGAEPWMNLRECNGRFGRCSMYEGCHDLEGDETKFDALYARKEG